MSTTALQGRTKAVRILVLGDIHLDSLLVSPASVRSADDPTMWKRDGHFLEFRHRGGAWLLTDIINAALASDSYATHLGDVIADTYDQGRNQVTDYHIANSPPNDFLRFSTLLGLFPQASQKDKHKVYRVDRFLGWINGPPGNMVKGLKHYLDDLQRRYVERLEQCVRQFQQATTAKYDILVLSDTANYFRRLPLEVLEDVITQRLNQDTGWIVWHMYSPLSKGHLWEAISNHTHWLNRTIVVVHLECMRQAGMELPQIASLEQESFLFAKGMKQIDSLKTLSKVQKIVAHQHREGAILYDRENGLESSCYYCPYLTTDPVGYGGTMIAYTSILVAAIVRGLASCISRDNGNVIDNGIIPAIQQAVVLDHLHYLNGFGTEEELNEVAMLDLRSPYDRLFKTLAHLATTKWESDGKSYVVTALPLPEVDALKDWNRVTGFINPPSRPSRPTLLPSSPEEAMKYEERAEQIACNIVLYGLKAAVETTTRTAGTLPDTPPNAVLCPYACLGKIKTVHRQEIDSFYNIRRIMKKYFDDETWTTPLSVAVFGHPGSGKSFTIREILETVKPEIAKRPLEFNLAQFEVPKDLEVAFHKVQDEAVAGDIPLVFFDEFDARSLHWLKFFLAPMQDGKFKAGESTYRIGRAVFVFAGGVSRSWHEFYEARKRKGGKMFSRFKNAKGPDFVSRLRGHLDISSINPPEGQQTVDWVLMFRRGILLRALLEKHLPEIIDKNSKEAWIDKDVVRAFLRILRYEHESRSMEAIIQMSQISPRRTLLNSSLPAADQLQMHVDASEFAKRVSRELV